MGHNVRSTSVEWLGLAQPLRRVRGRRGGGLGDERRRPDKHGAFLKESLRQVVSQSRRDVSTERMRARWQFADEWYNLVPFPSRVRILATVDEAMLPGGSGHPGHGRNHPVS
jgi:hypothetical protein